MLQKIKVDHFKSLKHLEYDCAGLNLLTGMNGAGKSSFVQLLRLMAKVAPKIGKPMSDIGIKDLGCKGLKELAYCYANEDPAFEVVFSAVDGKSAYCLSRKLETAVYGEGAGGIRVSRHDVLDVLVNEGQMAQDVLIHREEVLGQVVTEAEWHEARHLEKEELKRLDNVYARMIAEDADAAKVFADLWRCSRFVDAFRIKPTEIHKGGAYNPLEFVFENNPEVIYDPEGQNTVEYLYHCGTMNGDSLLKKVNACLQWVSPGARLNIKKQDVGDEVYYLASIDYGINGNSRKFKPQNVGFGVSYILPILVTLLSAQSGNIIIIENPEAHLHPRGQSEIGKLIAETVARGVQVFVETHSDHVINGIRVAVKKGIVTPRDVNIAFFERKPHGKEIYAEVTNIKIDANGSLSEYPKDFMDEWGLRQVRLMQ